MGKWITVAMTVPVVVTIASIAVTSLVLTKVIRTLKEGARQPAPSE